MGMKSIWLDYPVRSYSIGGAAPVESSRVRRRYTLKYILYKGSSKKNKWSNYSGSEPPHTYNFLMLGNK